MTYFGQSFKPRRPSLRPSPIPTGSTGKAPPSWLPLVSGSTGLPLPSVTGWPAALPATPPASRVTTPIPALADFLPHTRIEVPAGGTDTALAPFVLWPAQRDEVVPALLSERLLVFLKARQLGLSWLVCGYALHQCLTRAGQAWLYFSQGLLEAQELARRTSLMYHQYEGPGTLPELTKDNTGELAWANGSRVLSLPATKKAGRSFTASGVVLDEWAFMLWGRELLAAVKPTIDAGGQLIIISSADGLGSQYHQFWQAAKGGESGYRAIFLPWTARPDRGADWRQRKVVEANGDEAAVLREYPANDVEAFTAAAGLIYEGAWLDGEFGNVAEAADYLPGAGPVLWAVDDGYAGSLDPKTRTFTAESHPRVILFVQERANGDLCVFDERYAVQTLEPAHIAEALGLPYPEPDVAVVDKSAAALKGHLHAAGVATVSRAPGVEESIKVLRGMLARDANGRRRILVHPRCRHLRAEFASYRRTPEGKIVKAFDHGPDALRYLAFMKRHEAANLD